MADTIGLNCGIRNAREDKILRSPLVAGAWRDQVHGGKLGLEGLLLWVFCYSCTPTLFSSGSISTWRVMKRFFVKFFDFLFDNMSQYCLVFASLFPTL